MMFLLHFLMGMIIGVIPIYLFLHSVTRGVLHKLETIVISLSIAILVYPMLFILQLKFYKILPTMESYYTLVLPLVVIGLITHKLTKRKHMRYRTW